MIIVVTGISSEDINWIISFFIKDILIYSNCDFNLLLKIELNHEYYVELLLMVHVTPSSIYNVQNIYAYYYDFFYNFLIINIL